MTTTTLNPLLVPQRAQAPRGAQLVGLVYDLMARLAERRRLRQAVADAQAVREHARRIEASDPGMAADLLAAADRHIPA
jgi:hypothetical protein